MAINTSEIGFLRERPCLYTYSGLLRGYAEACLINRGEFALIQGQKNYFPDIPEFLNPSGGWKKTDIPRPWLDLTEIDFSEMTGIKENVEIKFPAEFLINDGWNKIRDTVEGYRFDPNLPSVDGTTYGEDSICAAQIYNEIETGLKFGKAAVKLLLDNLADGTEIRGKPFLLESFKNECENRHLDFSMIAREIPRQLEVAANAEKCAALDTRAALALVRDLNTSLAKRKPHSLKSLRVARRFLKSGIKPGRNQVPDDIRSTGNKFSASCYAVRWANATAKTNLLIDALVSVCLVHHYDDILARAGIRMPGKPSPEKIEEPTVANESNQAVIVSRVEHDVEPPRTPSEFLEALEKYNSDVFSAGEDLLIRCGQNLETIRQLSRLLIEGCDGKGVFLYTNFVGPELRHGTKKNTTLEIISAKSNIPIDILNQVASRRYLPAEPNERIRFLGQLNAICGNPSIARALKIKPERMQAALLATQLADTPDNQLDTVVLKTSAAIVQILNGKENHS